MRQMNGGSPVLAGACVLLFSVAAVAAEDLPVQLQIVSGAAAATGTLAPGGSIPYVILSPPGQNDLQVSIESETRKVGFTVWDSGYLKAEPVPWKNRRALPGASVAEGDVYSPNIEWRGTVLSREHHMVVINKGDSASTFTLRLHFR